MIQKFLSVFIITVLMTGVSYAYKLTLNGYNETEYRFIGNSSVGGGEGVSSENGSYVKQQLRIWSFLDMDEKTRLIMRITPINHRWGTSYQHNTTVIKGTPILDRAWVQYKPIDGLTLDCGFMTAANYSIKGWGQGWYNGGFTEFGPRSGGRVQYEKNSTKYWVQYEKTYETDDSDMFYDQYHNKDSDAVIAGMDSTFSNLKTHLYTSYYSTYGSTTTNNDRSGLGGVYGSVEYSFNDNLSTTLSGSYVGGTAYDTSNIYMKGTGNDVSAYGLYGDLVYTTNGYTAGLDLEYSSYDKEKGFFSLGGDLDRMYIMDDIMGDNRGVPAATSVRAYVTKNVTPKLAVTPAVAYYKSNVKDKDVAIAYGSPYNAKNTWTKDTSSLEFDLKATYQLNKIISFAGGYDVALIKNISTGDKDSDGNYETYDADPVQVAWLRFTASFQ